MDRSPDQTALPRCDWGPALRGEWPYARGLRWAFLALPVRVFPAVVVSAPAPLLEPIQDHVVLVPRIPLADFGAGQSLDLIQPLPFSDFLRRGFDRRADLDAFRAKRSVTFGALRLPLELGSLLVFVFGRVLGSAFPFALIQPFIRGCRLEGRVGLRNRGDASLAAGRSPSASRQICRRPDRDGCIQPLPE